MHLLLRQGARAVVRRRAAWCSTTAGEAQFPHVHPVGETLANPLSKEELTRHQEAERKWMEFSDKIQEARKGEWAELEKVIDEGIELSETLGQDLRRPGHEASLQLEAAHHYKTQGNLEQASVRSELAEKAFETDKDMAGTMRARAERGALQNATGAHEPAAEAFSSILEWSQNAGRRGTPMDQEAAETLQWTARLGLAVAHVHLGKQDSAHDLLAEALPHFANKSDAQNTWACLEAAEKNFTLMGDAASAKKAVERQVSWAKRHKLEAELAAAEARLAAMA